MCSYISKLLGKIKGEIILTFLLEKPIALITTCGAMWATCQVAQIYAKSCLKQGHKNNNVAVSFHIFGMVQQLIDLSYLFRIFFSYMANIWKSCNNAFFVWFLSIYDKYLEMVEILIKSNHD